jgi:predicted Zn-dependent protease with MMP-like domain
MGTRTTEGEIARMKDEPKDPLRLFGGAPTRDEIEEIARRQLASLPAPFLALAGHVALRVEEFPDAEILRDMEIDDPFELAGLYRGVPTTEKSVGEITQEPDSVLLFRRPILDWWAEEGMDLEALIRHLIVHEIGHHFGFSDADMERIEAVAESEDRGADKGGDIV